MQTVFPIDIPTGGRGASRALDVADEDLDEVSEGAAFNILMAEKSRRPSPDTTSLLDPQDVIPGEPDNVDAATNGGKTTELVRSELDIPSVKEASRSSNGEAVSSPTLAVATVTTRPTQHDETITSKAQVRSSPAGPDSKQPLIVGSGGDAKATNQEHSSAVRLVPIDAAAAVVTLAKTIPEVRPPSGQQTPTTSGKDFPTPPHAVGPKGHSKYGLAEEANMQLSRPHRLRTFPSAVAAVHLTSTDQAPPQLAQAAEDQPIILKVHAPLRAERDVKGQAKQPIGDENLAARTTAGPSIARMATAPAMMSGIMPAARREGDSSTNDTPRYQPKTGSAGPLLQTLSLTSTQSAYAPYAVSAVKQSRTFSVSPGEALLETSMVRPVVQPLPPLEPPSIGTRSLPPETADILAKQLAQIAQNQSWQRRDILLNPEELGRVRLNLIAQETSVHVSILVERPETLDLMRRNIGQLTAELRSLGYQDVSFDFTQSQTHEDQATRDDPAHAVEDQAQSETAALPMITHPGLQPNGQLDLRL